MSAVHVTVIAEVSPDTGEVLFRVASADKPLSPVYRIKRSTADGNPYLLYGPHAAAWVGVKSWQDTKITVAQVTSGRLEA